MQRNRKNININLLPFRRDSSGRRVGLLGSGFAIGAFISFLGFGSVMGVAPLELLAGGVGPLRTQKTPSERLIVQGSVIDIAKKTQPSIVGIQTQQEPGRGRMGGPGGGTETESVGSGVIIRRDGYIMTNSHVVGEASSIVVTLGDEKVPADVIGADKDTDIAVIKIDRDRLPVAKLGSAKDLEVGELAVAIGSPFGFQRSVTAGVISALNRNVTVGGEADRPRTYTNLIQTDAAINPGNSGGALLNREGEVIGINTLIYSTNGVSQGIGFAIPVEEAKNVAQELVEEGRVNHAFIGVEGRSVTPEAGDDNTINQGAQIVDLTAGGPAERAGLQRGDIVIEFDGSTVTSMDDLVAAVRDAGEGHSVTLRVIRNGSTEGLTIEIGERPRSPSSG